MGKLIYSQLNTLGVKENIVNIDSITIKEKVFPLKFEITFNRWSI